MTSATMTPEPPRRSNAGAGEPSERRSIALVCGGGTLPGAVAAAIATRGLRPVLFAIRGWADPKIVEPYAHHWVALGQIGRFLRLPRAQQCREAGIIRPLLRPPPPKNGLRL